MPLSSEARRRISRSKYSMPSSPCQHLADGLAAAAKASRDSDDEVFAHMRPPLLFAQIRLFDGIIVQQIPGIALEHDIARL